ncbi:hypothetical protein ACJJTC_015965 [Scirpophaga incertulas]
MDESRNSPAAASVGSKRKLSTSGSSSDYARDGDHSKVSDSDSPVRQAPSKKARSSRHADGSRRRGGAGHADHVGGEFRERRRSVSLEADMDQRFAVLSQQLVSHINNILTTNLHMQAVPTLSCLNSASNCNDLPTQNSNIPIVNNGEFLNPPSCSVVENISDLSVTVKEPSITTALPDRVVKLTALQRFDSPNWNAVRKLKELFGDNSDYKSASHDILQITCGKRAEVIESRRRNILKNIKVKYIRDDIGKIPPSCDYMFNPSALANYLQKIGGIDKVDKQTAPVQHTARTFSPHNKSFQQPRTANKTRRNERKESNRINNDEASSKRKGEAKNKNIRKPYKNNKP